MVNIEEKVFKIVKEEISNYRVSLENEFAKDTSDIELRMRMHSAYYVEDMFPLIYKSSMYDISELCKGNSVMFKASVTLKVYKVLLSLRNVADGWTSEIVEGIVDDIARRVFSIDMD